MEVIEAQNPSIGAFVLESLTVGMYSDARDSIREYIQNALDGITAAKSEGLITEGNGKIEIQQSPELSRLIISDNGIGISHEKALQTLISIGTSSKQHGTYAGFRGIGRLAGIAYCDRLIFETSHVNEEIGTRIELDCKELRESFKPNKSGKTKELEEVMRRCYNFSDFDEAGDSHFFRVTMQNMIGDGETFMDFNHLSEYLCQYAPLDYNSQKFIWASRIRERILTSSFAIPVVEVKLNNDNNGSHPMLKPYRGRVQIKENKKLDISDIEFFDDPSGENRYWGWRSKSELLGTIINKELAGLRIRVANILVGGPALTTQFFASGSDSNSRFNKYFIGEIFLQPNLVIPNARRDGFEDTPEWRAIREDFEKLAKELSAEVRKVSSNRNKSLPKIRTEAEKVIHQADEQIDQGFTSNEDKVRQIKKINNVLVKINSMNMSGRDEGEKSEIENIMSKLKIKIEEINKTSKYATGNLKGVLDKKQIYILRKVYDILKSELEENQYIRLKEKIEMELKSKSNS